MHVAETQDSASSRLGFLPIAFFVLLLVAGVYWPLSRAGLVWDDKIWISDQAWLRDGDAWRHLMFHGFYEWGAYFRPLVVALFTVEVRVFHGVPLPLHLISLGLHLANTLLVGLLARRLCGTADKPVSRAWAGAAMAIYGVHPALVEPVAWISAQSDLLVNFFVLLGLLIHIAVSRTLLRASGVACCFFLAACAKESAISMPALLVLADLTRLAGATGRPSLATGLLECWRRQKAIYLAVLFAGVAYLGARHWALGAMTPAASGEPMSIFARMQMVCFTYATYLRMIVWPMLGLSPIHIVDVGAFSKPGLESAAMDAFSVAVIAGSVYFGCRLRIAGLLGLAITAALFPVLHIIPIAFEESLYHERYAALAIAVICIWLPGLASGPTTSPKFGSIRWLVPAAAAGWFVIAVLNTAAIIPLWSDEIRLWLWVLSSHPDSVEAKDHLLSTYIERHDPHAQTLADQLVAGHAECPTCMLNAAYLALANKDERRAEAAVKRLQNSPSLTSSVSLTAGYFLCVGELLELKRDPMEAEQAFRASIKMEPYDPQPHAQLALLLAREHRVSDAWEAEKTAIALLPGNQQSPQNQEFRQALNHPDLVPGSP